MKSCIKIFTNHFWFLGVNSGYTHGHGYGYGGYGHGYGYGGYGYNGRY